MRAADLADHARVEATLIRLLDHLDAAPIDPATAALLTDTAARILRRRNATTPCGWILAYHGDTTAVHVDLVTLVLLLQRADGRLAYLLDLDQLWRQGAGDTHLLAEAATRMPKEPTR